MEYEDIDQTVVCTQIAKAGSADLYATMPWVAKLPNHSNLHQCEAHSFGQRRRCKRNAAVLHVDLDGSFHFFCATHLHMCRLSEMYAGYEDTPQLRRVRKFFDKYVDWSARHNADVDTYNKQFDGAGS